MYDERKHFEFLIEFTKHQSCLGKNIKSAYINSKFFKAIKVYVKFFLTFPTTQTIFHKI